ncbi:MAG TPA: hypothetical protein VKQ72_01060 [Aggregatilineales bacterium]|nr:hypothetical protein [Aggregatilineales bacterium]
MTVQLSIPFETLVSLVEQLPESEKKNLIERVKVHATASELSPEQKIALFESMAIDAEVIEVPSVRREDWYGDDGR